MTSALLRKCVNFHATAICRKLAERGKPFLLRTKCGDYPSSKEITTMGLFGVITFALLSKFVNFHTPAIC
jgi:hypothetical protein